MPGEKLPVVSNEEQVQKNCMKLYVYLISISNFAGIDKPRFFLQGDFNINRIHKTIGMHESTIKKYWKLLEDEGLIKYEGQSIKTPSQSVWNKQFMERKKISATYYTIPKKTPYKIIPKETLDKMVKGFQVDDIELKIYLLLANMQEKFVYFDTPRDRRFSLKDLRELLGVSKNQSKKIMQSLQWLKELNLIEYECKKENNNLGGISYFYELISVNYYTNGGKAFAIMSGEESIMSDDLKSKILNEVLISLEEDEKELVENDGIALAS